MDTRSFRNDSAAADNAAKTMLGTAQKEDLLKWLSSAEERFKFLFSTVPWHDCSTTGNHLWQGCKTERNEIYN